MAKSEITDELLYEYYPRVEGYVLNKLPKEGDIEYEFSDIFNQKMKKLLKESKRPKFINSMYMNSKKVSIVVIAFIISIFTLTMSVEALRIQLFELIKNVSEKFTIYQFDVKDDVDIKNGTFKEINYLPYGFKEIDRRVDEGSIFVSYSSDTEYLTFSGFRVTDSNLYIDTEDANISKVMINNVEGDYIVKENDHKLVWEDENNIYILTLEYLDSSIVSNKERTLVKIAEKIK
ncbi:MAG: DUF4367 domain-containing protein [Paraclostridium sp.]